MSKTVGFAGTEQDARGAVVRFDSVPVEQVPDLQARYDVKAAKSPTQKAAEGWKKPLSGTPRPERADDKPKPEQRKDGKRLSPIERAVQAWKTPGEFTRD